MARLKSVGIIAALTALRFTTAIAGPLADASVNLTKAEAQIGQMLLSSVGEDRFLDMALTAVRDQLKDPDSATFRNVRIVDFFNGSIVCGEVNAKNSFGGYVGFTPFYSPGPIARIWETKNQNRTMEMEYNAGLIAACGN